jgi:hypothetical protein
MKGIRAKFYPTFEKPSLAGSVLLPQIMKKIQASMLSSTDNIFKRILPTQGEIAVASTAEKVAKKMSQHNIRYAIIGGFALNIHGYKRHTEDIDVLIHSDDLSKFMDKVVYSGFTPRFPGAKRSFRDPVSYTGVDLLVSGEYPGDGKPGPIAFPIPDASNIEVIEDVQIINLPTFIDLKLASYNSMKKKRMKDRTDVEGLVKSLSLGKDFATRLHESVRDEFCAIVEDVIEESSNKA